MKYFSFYGSDFWQICQREWILLEFLTRFYIFTFLFHFILHFYTFISYCKQFRSDDCTLYIGGTHELRDKDLMKYFSFYGTVTDAETFQKGFSFVSFFNREQAIRAYQDGYKHRNLSRHLISGVLCQCNLKLPIDPVSLNTEFV